MFWRFEKINIKRIRRIGDVVSEACDTYRLNSEYNNGLRTA